jgi:superfamily II DNA or RNA helicase/HKD family nuclease
MLQEGLYEQVIHELLAKQLEHDTQFDKVVDSIDEAEAFQVLTAYVSEVLQKGLFHLQGSKESLKAQIALCNDIIALVRKATCDAQYEPSAIDDRAQQLLALFHKQNSPYALTKESIPRPVTSLSASSLFTGSVHEPRLHVEFQKEIQSSDRIDMLVSFIKWSGLRLIWEALQTFAGRGGVLRVITTSYMGATDARAIEALSSLPGAKIRISYDTRHTRLHAKTYVFHRHTGFSTAYIGSANLSGAALSEGLEWNMKVTAHDLPSTMRKIDATFESYWHADEFELFTLEHQDRLRTALQSERVGMDQQDAMYLFDIRPYPFQQQILDMLQAEREVRGRHKNLIVAATGTGKTVISAFDYKRFVQSNKQKTKRLLFIAHREEILQQSIACFRGVLRDPNFGDLFVGSNRPSSIEHLFMSIQTFNAQSWHEKTTEDYYDYIVVDEFHHAAAPSYVKMLSYYKPYIMIGLTATPERLDGKDVLTWFDDHIAAEIRLPEAIRRGLLCPFHYFGVTDTVNLEDMRWTRGGYDRAQLSNTYTLTGEIADRRAQHIVQSLARYITEMTAVKGLGFCVSVEHAHYMAEFFCRSGIPSMALDGMSTQAERLSAPKQLVTGELKFLFVVDLYNEGIDIPEVNTVLFLRPTESLTVFLQQLGRGLRLSPGKECLTVLDFIGQAHVKYDYAQKFTVLLGDTRHGIFNEVKSGFVNAPQGCFIQLERLAQKYVLDNIRKAVNSLSGLRLHIASFSSDTGQPLTLTRFIKHHHLDLRSLYRRKVSFARLCVSVGVREDFSEPMEEQIARALPRICTVDSRRLIVFWLRVLSNPAGIDPKSLSAVELAMLRMLCVTIVPDMAPNFAPENLMSFLNTIALCPILADEICEVLNYQFQSIDFVDQEVPLGFASPLDLHCTYTRDQLLVGLGMLYPASMREGVKWMPNIRCDVFTITLNKSDRDYSPTTMYDDYSINEHLFHWQSQSTTSAESPTGQRYQLHGTAGHQVLLFVREYKQDGYGGSSPYTYLGTASYISHEGSRPMSIIYRLHQPIPAKMLKQTNKLLI